MEARFDLAEGQQIQEVATMALSVPDQAKQIVIASNEDYVRAGELLLVIKEIRKKIEATFKPIKQKMDAAKKEVLDQERAADAPLVAAENIIKPRIAAWNADQERIRREEETRLREIARKEEEERRLQEAILAEQSGETEVADEIMSAPVQAAPVVIPKSVPKVAGVSLGKKWTFRVVDPNLVPRQYLSVDEQKIRSVVNGLKDQAHIPGVEIYSVDTVSAGRRVA